MSKPREHKTPHGYIWYRLNNDDYGNPRVMTHFLTLVSPKQQRKAHDMHPTNIDALKQWAKERVNGKNYRARWFDGGIVWQSYLSDKQIDDLIDSIQADK